MASEDLILKLLHELDVQAPKYKKLLDYYEGRHKLLFEQPKVEDSRNDERAIFNYCQKTVQNFVGYLLGKPINYQSKSGNKDFINSIEKHFAFWEKEHNIRLKELTEIYGLAYEVCYSTSQKEFLCACFSPLEMITLNDGTIERNTSLAVRRYQKPYDDSTYVDVWDDKYLTKYVLNNKKLVQLSRKRHIFSICPVNEVVNNDSKRSAFDGIVRINDLYNAVNSSAANEMLDHRSAYLVIENADLDLDEAIKMKQNGIILAPAGSKVYWSVKDVNNAFFKDMIKQWQDEFYIQTNTVNLNENFQSNTSGVSIRLKLQELENLSAIKESIFERALKRRFKLFCEWLMIAESNEFDYRDLSISFTRNVPVDEVAIANMIILLKDMLPHEDLISWLPRVTNPQSAIQKLKNERDAMGLYTLDEHLKKQNGVLNEKI
ncbi:MULTISPECIES: phage portal protein [Cytobacillus]|uniref:phage portal protein n=1 Tax=Cytobacillus TaxID=2675230 RepID=UPI00203E945B|nr:MULTISPECIES: phage portal protein [Cytobacillus]MCM3394859.1 phage portal protein [Cytobacillus oceanisediminis]UQX56061.1 phage portal protein [Cytobacillus pseudoceanisediminis]